ncbi:MAG: class I SAM-dependent RNA methyltransferase, partial [Acidobacteriales bacterium]|nr:class I SAM-dependent RNA methyltransferase [Terriglobales bacterium]
TIHTERAKKGLVRGSLLNVLEPSGQRVTPRCEYFGHCGGCHYQHANYEHQLAGKVAILRETLARLGRIDYSDEIAVISGEPWFYRNRIQLHFRNSRSGFHKQNSHEVQAINHCYISAPELVEAIAKFSEAVRRPEWPDFLRSLELFSNGSELQLNVLDTNRPVAATFFEWCGTFLPSLVQGALYYPAAGFRFRISGSSFFQVNRFLIDALVEEATAAYSGQHAADVYAGVGLFSIALAKRFTRVDAVERGASASRDLEVNVAESRLAIRPFKATAEQYLASTEGNSPDFMLADPPRSGLGRETVAALLSRKPAYLTLVSCDPATLARDSRLLLTEYRIRRLALVDLFPQTYHFETVMHLERR